MKEKLRVMVSKGNIKECISELLSFSESISSSQLQNEILSISSQYKIYLKENRSGILNREQKQLTTSRITKSILEIIDELEDFKPKQPVPEDIGNQNSQKFDLEEKKRLNDLLNLNWLLSNIHTPTIDLFLEEFPDYINSNLIHFWEGFKGVKMSSTFYIYDKSLTQLINNLFEKWHKALSYDKHYYSLQKGNKHKFTLPFEEPQRTEAESDFEFLVQHKFKLKSCYDDFLNYIRENYLEIDIQATNLKAIEEFREFYK